MISEIYKQAEKLAKKVREDFELGNAPIKDIFKLLEAHGIFVVRMPIEGKSLHGAFCWDAEKESARILINSKRSLGRQIFTAAHELCHFYLDKNKGQIVDRGEDKTDEERRADSFASNLLMPKEGVENYIEDILKIDGKEISDVDIVKIKNEFGASWFATLYRLYRLRYVFDKDFELKKRVKEISKLNSLSASMGYEPENFGGDDEVVEIEMPSDYYHKAFDSYFKGKISLGRLAELLRRSYEKTRKEVAQIEKLKNEKSEE